MSGIIIQKKSSQYSPVEISLKKLCFTKSTNNFEGQAGSFNYGLSWIYSEDFTPFIHKPDLGISISMLGRLYDMSDEMIISNKFLNVTNDYNNNSIEALTKFSGAGALVLFDHVKNTCFIITDRMGFFPLYVTRLTSEHKTVICSHADILAAVISKSLDFDEVTLAEYLALGTCSHPYTFYKDILQLDAGSIYQWTNSGFSKVRTYWKPEPTPDNSASVDDFAGELAELIKHSVNLRLKNSNGKAGLLLSGGLDSRALLFSVHNPADNFVGITFYNEINREVRYAQDLARLAGIKQILLKRDFDYYGKLAIDAVKISGGMGDFTTAHTLGFTQDINNLGLRLILSGYLMDTFFKGYPLDWEWHRPFGIWLKKQQLSKFSFEWEEDAPFFFMKNDRLCNKIKDRLSDKYKGIELNKPSIENRMKIEMRRMYPISHTTDGAFRVTMLNTLPFDFFISDNHFFELFERIPPKVKLNGNLLVKTLLKISPLTVHVPNSNDGADLVASIIKMTMQKLAQRLMNRLTRARLKNSIATNGSWINWQYYYKNSQYIQNIWNGIPHHIKDYIVDILGYDAFLEPLSVWAEKQKLLGRIFTLSLWLQYKIR